MLVRNPNLYANIQQAIRYFGLPTDRNVNFRLPTKLEFKPKKFLLQSINGINHAIVDFNADPLLTSILLMLNHVNDELITTDYYVVPFEQTLNFFDNYDVLGVAFDRAQFALDLYKQGKLDITSNFALLQYKSHYIVNKDLSPMVYYGSLPLAYYTVSVLRCIVNKQYTSQHDLLIGSLIVHLLYDYSVSILQEANIPEYTLKPLQQKHTVPEQYLQARNQLLQLLAKHQL